MSAVEFLHDKVAFIGTWKSYCAARQGEKVRLWSGAEQTFVPAPALARPPPSF